MACLGCSAGEGVALRARPLDAGLTPCPTAEAAVPWPEPSADPEADTQPHRYFAIRVRDADSGLPLAGATLETVHHVIYQSDQNGWIAFYEPGLMGTDVFFTPRRPGYLYPSDGFGFRGHAFRTNEGEQAELALPRAGDVTDIASDDRATRAIAGEVPRDCLLVRVVDQVSKRGVPLVFLDSARERYVSDSQGMVAICDPDALLAPLTLSISSHGYSYPPREVTLDPKSKSARIELVRNNIAERLYRSTGAGLYRDSVLLGLNTPIRQPLLNAGVLGQDGVGVTKVGDLLLWTWGITDRAKYPLGNFASCGAFTARNVDPARGFEFAYFTDDTNFCRPLTGTLPPNDLGTWLTSVFNAGDQVFAVYTKPDGMLVPQGRGLVRFDTTQNAFVDTGVRFPLGSYVPPEGQSIRVQHADQAWLYFASPVRVPEAAVTDSASYQATVVQSSLRDARTGSSITNNGNAGQAYSNYRQRYVRIFTQLGGSSSFLGEVWYAEADTPLGPWVYAQKILTHDRYTFAGPWVHDAFASRDHGRSLYFEGTYTDALIGDDIPRTPRYNRNQLMHRLDLDAPELILPVAIYDGYTTRPTSAAAPLFYAPDRQAPGTLPVAWSGPDCEPRTLEFPGTTTPALFYAMSAQDASRPSYLVPLDERAYVWPAPASTPLPVQDYVGPLRAYAGADQCLGHDQELLLDASASLVPKGNVRYSWLRYGDECNRREGELVRMRLPPGVHAFILEVEDAAGNLSHDSMIVSVRE